MEAAMTPTDKLQWISVEDRLPDTTQCPEPPCFSPVVLVFTSRGSVSTDQYYPGGPWMHHGDLESALITHWMPLPPPPSLPINSKEAKPINLIGIDSQLIDGEVASVKDESSPFLTMAVEQVRNHRDAIMNAEKDRFEARRDDLMRPEGDTTHVKDDGEIFSGVTLYYKNEEISALKAHVEELKGQIGELVNVGNSLARECHDLYATCDDSIIERCKEWESAIIKLTIMKP
jgi:hypothetical protein